MIDEQQPSGGGAKMLTPQADKAPTRHGPYPAPPAPSELTFFVALDLSCNVTQPEADTLLPTNEFRSEEHIDDDDDDDDDGGDSQIMIPTTAGGSAGGSERSTRTPPAVGGGSADGGGAEFHPPENSGGGGARLSSASSADAAAASKKQKKGLGGGGGGGPGGFVGKIKKKATYSRGGGGRGSRSVGPSSVFGDVLRISRRVGPPPPSDGKNSCPSDRNEANDREGRPEDNLSVPFDEKSGSGTKKQPSSRSRSSEANFSFGNNITDASPILLPVEKENLPPVPQCQFHPPSLLLPGGIPKVIDTSVDSSSSRSRSRGRDSSKKKSKPLGDFDCIEIKDTFSDGDDVLLLDRHRRRRVGKGEGTNNNINSDNKKKNTFVEIESCLSGEEDWVDFEGQSVGAAAAAAAASAAMSQVSEKGNPDAAKDDVGADDDSDDDDTVDQDDDGLDWVVNDDGVIDVGAPKGKSKDRCVVLGTDNAPSPGEGHGEGKDDDESTITERLEYLEGKIKSMERRKMAQCVVNSSFDDQFKMCVESTPSPITPTSSSDGECDCDDHGRGDDGAFPDFDQVIFTPSPPREEMKIEGRGMSPIVENGISREDESPVDCYRVAKKKSTTDKENGKTQEGIETPVCRVLFASSPAKEEKSSAKEKTDVGNNKKSSQKETGKKASQDEQDLEWIDSIHKVPIDLPAESPTKKRLSMLCPDNKRVVFNSVKDVQYFVPEDEEPEQYTCRNRFACGSGGVKTKPTMEGFMSEGSAGLASLQSAFLSAMSCVIGPTTDFSLYGIPTATPSKEETNAGGSMSSPTSVASEFPSSESSKQRLI